MLRVDTTAAFQQAKPEPTKAAGSNEAIEKKIYLPYIANNSTNNIVEYTIEKTLSDGAQRNTIAFD
jgi:hypothetical protein